MSNFMIVPSIYKSHLNFMVFELYIPIGILKNHTKFPILADIMGPCPCTIFNPVPPNPPQHFSQTKMLGN